MIPDRGGLRHLPAPTGVDALPSDPAARRTGQPSHDVRDLPNRAEAVLQRRRPPLQVLDLGGDLLQHVRLDGARGDGVHRRAVPAELGGPGAREALDRRLGRGVQAQRAEPRPGPDRGDVDDAAPRGQVRQDGLRGEDDPADVGVVGPLVVLQRDLREGPDDLDPGVVHQYVDLAVRRPRQGCGDELPGPVDVGEVRADAVGLGLVRQGLDLALDLRDLRGAGVGGEAEDDLARALARLTAGEGMGWARRGRLTLAPSWASLRAMPSPMPRDAPVTMAVLPWSGSELLSAILEATTSSQYSQAGSSAIIVAVPLATSDSC